MRRGKRRGRASGKSKVHHDFKRGDIVTVTGGLYLGWMGSVYNPETDNVGVSLSKDRYGASLSRAIFTGIQYEQLAKI